MITYAAAYGATLLVFVAADMIWLGATASRIYRPVLGDIAAPDVRLVPAVIFYVLYPAGLVIFAVAGGLKSGSALSTISYGALFGFFTYATYDLSNYATLRNWTLQLTMIDVAWGTVLGAIAALAGYLLASNFRT
jgi:uncharacterized membrane protein